MFFSCRILTPSLLEFLELDSSFANLTGSLPRGNGVNSDPISISLPNGFLFPVHHFCKSLLLNGHHNAGHLVLF